MDAAIAANAVLGVTEPMMNGIGGDLFLLYWDAKSGRLFGLNASGWGAASVGPEGP
jgi:gamma-glutamyltranspeptidase/glutathione hydrolase